MECNNILGYPGWETSPKPLAAVGLCPWSLLFPPKRDLLFHRQSGTHSVLCNEGAERQQLTNLAVLVKDIITFSCLFFCHPSGRGCCPHSTSQGTEHAALLAHTAQGAKPGAAASSHSWGASETPKSALQQERCRSRSRSSPRGWGLLSCPCQHSWCGCL